jgi:hypothetical protein
MVDPFEINVVERFLFDGIRSDKYASFLVIDLDEPHLAYTWVSTDALKDVCNRVLLAVRPSGFPAALIPGLLAL